MLCYTDVTNNIRRFKIQECHIRNSLNKIVSNSLQGQVGIPEYHNTKTLLDKTKNAYVDINGLLRHLKGLIQEKNCEFDINEIKKDVLHLEEKIKTFKIFLDTQICSLKATEIMLSKELNENTILLNKKKIVSKTKVKSYEAAVSPVKMLINSPPKFQEVQQFQDFMKTSSNRYGGWNEYNHNIFTECWQKYFKSNNSDNRHEINISEYSFQLFSKEISEKISNIKIEDVISHFTWYSKYIFLKEQQQKALEKWRVRKGVAKKLNRSEKDNAQFSATMPTIPRKLCQNDVTCNSRQNESGQRNSPASIHVISEENGKQAKGKNSNVKCKSKEIINEKDPQSKEYVSWKRIAQPTEQWKNRSVKIEEPVKIQNIEAISKLRIPYWRLQLSGNLQK